MRISPTFRRLAGPRSSFLTSSVISSALALSIGACGAPEDTEVAALGLVRTAAADPVGYQAARASADYTETPVGLVHRDCLVEVPAQAEVDETGGITYSDGRKVAPTPCAHPRYLAKSEGGPSSKVAAELAGATARAGSIYGYVGTAVDSPTWLSRLVENLTVPANPATKGGKVTFSVQLQPSLDNAGTVLKSVLEWDGARWTIGVYYTWGANKVVKSIADGEVKSGDSLWAGIESSRCTPEGSHCTWDVSLRNRRTWKTAHIKVVSYDRFATAITGDTEFNGLSSCSMLPANGFITFSGLQLFDGKGQPEERSMWEIPGDVCHLDLKDAGISRTFSWSTK